MYWSLNHIITLLRKLNAMVMSTLSAVVDNGQSCKLLCRRRNTCKLDRSSDRLSPERSTEDERRRSANIEERNA